MDTKHLRTFQAVVDCGSYAKAAERLGYTQPTITVHIQQLERDLGIPLFERIGRRQVLTQKGTEVLAQTADILSSVERLESMGADEAALSGTLRVDLAETLLCHAMDEAIVEFRRRAPGVALRLRDRTCLQVSENLRSGACDLGLTYAFDWQPEAFTFWKVAETRVVVVAAPDAPMPDLDEPRQEIRTPFITDEPDNVFRIALEDRLRTDGSHLSETIELWSSQAIKHLVALGQGFSVSPRFAVADELASGTFREIPCHLSEKTFPVLLGHRKKQWLSPAAQLFAELAEKALRANPSLQPS